MARSKNTWRPMRSRKSGRKTNKRVAENLKVIKQLLTVN